MTEDLKDVREDLARAADVDGDILCRAALREIEELEAKLAKALEALEEAWFMLTVPLLNYEPAPEEPGLRRIKSTLAELTGGQDE